MEPKGIDLSNNVNNEGVDAKDRISELPEFIIHHILSFLSTKTVVQTSLLSKRWNGFTSSYPVLDFNEDYFQDKKIPTREYKPEQKFMPKYEEFQTREKVMHFLNNSLLRFCEQKICIDTLMLKVTLLNKKNTALVNKWVQMAVENRVKVLDVVVTKNKKTLYRLPDIVFSAKRLAVLKLVGCRLEHSNMKNTINLYSLKELSLGKVYVEEQMLQNLVSCCPSIEHLTLEYCIGLKNFHAHAPLKYLTILTLKKLETVCYIEGSSIRNLTYRYPTGGELGEIKVNACQNLRELSLTAASITDQCLYDLGTKFPHLQTLDLSDCNMLETVHISSPSLNMLTLWFCKKLREGEIDTPNLRNFTVYSYDKFPKLSLKSGGSCQTSAYCLTYSCSNYQYHLNTDWLLELREFLKNTNRTKTLTLDIKGQVACNLEEFLPTPPYDLELLRLNLLPPSTGYSDIVNGLFLTFHPKTLLVHSSYNNVSCKNFLCECLMHKEDSGCCGSTHIKCWSHYLKNAIIENFGENKVEMPLDQDTPFDELGKVKDVCLKLLWQS